MNPDNFHFDSVQYSLMSKTLDMYVCLTIVDILNNILSFIFFILS